MTTLNISLTTLEQFRQFREERPVYLNEAKLKNGLQEGFKESEASINGSAAHKVLEIGAKPFISKAKANFEPCTIEWTDTWPVEKSYKVVTDLQSLYDLEEIRNIYNVEGAVNEQFGKMYFTVGNYRIRIGMRLDLTGPNFVVDYKTSKYGNDSPYGGSKKKYENSLQYKAYLLYTDKPIFIYHFIKVQQRLGKTAFTNQGFCTFTQDPKTEIKLLNEIQYLIDFAERFNLIQNLIYTKPE
jgi:hypothetical protein